MFARKISKRVGRALVFSLGIAVLSSTASAQVYDKKTTVTFSAPVEIPGPSAQILPAGSYVFRLLDSLSDRNVVQIFSRDERSLHATVLAIPNYRLQATDKTVMTFAERRAGDPQAIRAWFYPGDNWGQEFVYPKAQAVEIARVTRQPVLYIPDEVAPYIVAPVASPTEPAVVVLKEAPIMAVQPTGETVAVTQVVERPPVQQARLPKTASELPLLAMMGFLCLGVAISLKALCAR